MKELLEVRRELHDLKTELRGKQQMAVQSKGGHNAEVGRLKRRMGAQEKLIEELQKEMSRREEQEHEQRVQVQEQAESVERTLSDQILMLKDDLVQSEQKFMEERSKRHKIEQAKREAVTKMREAKERRAVAVGEQRRAEEKLMATQAQVDRKGKNRQAAEQADLRLKDEKREHQREVSKLLAMMEEQKKQNNIAGGALMASEEAFRACQKASHTTRKLYEEIFSH